MNSGAISQPKASTITSVGASCAPGGGACQSRSSTPGQPCGAIQARAEASSTHRRTRWPCPASWVARRQHTPMSPKLSITRQNTSHCNLGWVVKVGRWVRLISVVHVAIITHGSRNWRCPRQGRRARAAPPRWRRPPARSAWRCDSGGKARRASGGRFMACAGGPPAGAPRWRETLPSARTA